MASALDLQFFKDYPTALGFIELFDFLPEVVFYAKDRRSRFVAANEAMMRSKQLVQGEDLLGKTDLDFHPPVMARAYIEEDREIMESGKALPHQAWLVFDSDGRPGWFRSSKTPIFGDTGKVIGIAGVRYSIRTPEEQMAQFQNLLGAIRHLEENYTEGVTTPELAKLAGLSVTHFNRRFSELFRMSPNRFMMSLRVERARTLLSQSEREIGEISVETGFCDQSHFTRQFRKLTGLTPKKYREQFSVR